MERCISSVSYIKPQPRVVPTVIVSCCISSVSYIKPQLSSSVQEAEDRCISSVSYIKPQLSRAVWCNNQCCISSVSYIKPQPLCVWRGRCRVVYRPFPTSNHNWSAGLIACRYVVYRPFPTSNHNLHVVLFAGAIVVYRPFPTSNHNILASVTLALTVVYRPFPTSNHNQQRFTTRLVWLYIVRFLHQTTTALEFSPVDFGCISSVSYIKPQLNTVSFLCISVVYRPFPTSNHNPGSVSNPRRHVVYRPFPTSNHNRAGIAFGHEWVVYRPFPTSNHNRQALALRRPLLYIVRFLHQTTTSCLWYCWWRWLYIVRFLHQTTTESYCSRERGRCISSVSYIKPQPIPIKVMN